METIDEKITGFISKLQRLKELAKQYQEKWPNYPFSGEINHSGDDFWQDNTHLLVNDIDLKLDELWELIKEHTSAEDNFVGRYAMPTSEVFAVNFSRDIKHIIDSREPDKVDALIQLLKKVQRRHIAKQASGEAENTTEPNKPQKPTGDSVGQLINYINAVLDDIQQLRACRSSNPHVSKKIRIELAVAYHETKKCVEKILAEHPEIKDAPAESDDQEKYLRSAHTWCVGQLFWENGERIGAEKTADKSAEKPAEIQQSQRTEIPSEIKLLEQVADKLEEWANRVEPKLPAHIGHISFYGSLKKALDNLSDLAFTWLRSRMPRHLDSIQKDFNDLYEKAKAVDHERSESGGEANILKCQAQAAAKKLAQKLRLIVKMTKENLAAEKPAETEQNVTPAKLRRIWICLKRIPRWICGLVVAVFVAVIAAIVVDIFAEFGWLGQIKAFIEKIVWPE